ncbi:MAG: hypothetical protein GF364_22400, partial [Candidatus Lokiarchaeota archaeon]|nr:hypothetical protein [Candidatus Lokiarchaeota archaeon]
MLEKRNRILILTGLLAFFLLSPLSLSGLMLDNENNDQKADNPSSSFDQSYSGSDGSNLGIYGYTNGTKSGSQSDSDTWSTETGRGGTYTRGPDIPFSLPSSGTWQVTSMMTDVTDLKVSRNVISDGDFSGSDWTAGVTSYSLNPGDGSNSLIYGSSITSVPLSNNYFNNRESAVFRVGKNDYITSVNINTGTVNHDSNDSPTETWANHESRCYYHFDNGFGDVEDRACEGLAGTCGIGATNMASLGYRDGGPGGGANDGWEDAYFSHSGLDKSLDYFDPTSPSYGGSSGHGTYASQSYSHPYDDISITGYLQSYGSSGGDSKDCYAELWLYSTLKFDNTMEWTTTTDLDVPWVDDGSPPHNCIVSYTLDPNGRFNIPGVNWFNTGNRYDSKHWERAWVEVTRKLINPFGSVVSGTTETLRWGYGGHSTTTAISRNPNFASYIDPTTSTTPYKIRFETKLHLEAHCNYDHIEIDHKSRPFWPWEKDDVHDTVEIESKVYAGIDIDNLAISVYDDRPWDSGNGHKDVYYDHSNIDFDDCIINANDPVVLEFDWYVGDDINDGEYYQYGDVPVNALQFAYPFIKVEWTNSNHPTTPTGSEYIFDENLETLADVKGRPASSVPQWPWLGAGTGHGSDTGGAHFYKSWDEGPLYLSGADSISVSVGFRFEDDFLTDYAMSLTNNYLLITNVTSDLIVEPDVNYIDAEIVWEYGSGYGAWDLTPDGKGQGSLLLTSGLENYDNYATQEWYFRFDEMTNWASYSYSITLIIEDQDWSVTTTYKIRNNSQAEFYANFTQTLPNDVSLTDNWKNNFWFDLFFPKYMLSGTGDPY